MEVTQTKNEISYISDYAVLIKKMRLLRRLNRQQAALIFDYTHKNLEKIENGRSNISLERFRLFQDKYGFSDRELEELRSGKIKVTTDANSIRKKTTTKNRADRRFCHRQITRECKVLKEMRLMKNIDQYSASKLCGFGRNTIGFIENGRVTLTDKKISFVVATYGHTMEPFNQLLKRPLLRHEMIEQCQIMIQQMDENKLRILTPMLQAMK